LSPYSQISDCFLPEFQPDDEWSESEDGESTSKDAVTDLPSATRRIRALEKRLADAKQDQADYRKFVGERLNLSRLTDAIDDSSSGAALPRDDDSHYFESYNDNGKYPIVDFYFWLVWEIFLTQFEQTSMPL